MEIYGNIIGAKLCKTQKGSEYIVATIATEWSEFDIKYATCKGSKILTFSLNGDLCQSFKSEVFATGKTQVKLTAQYGKKVVDGKIATDYNKIEVVGYEVKK